VLNISRSGFYDWLGRPEPPRELRNKELVKIIREIHAESRGSYGSPRVHAELRLGKGMQVNRKRVERLMRDEGLQGIYRRRGRRNGKAYCAAVIDAYSRRIIGWSIDNSTFAVTRRWFPRPGGWRGFLRVSAGQGEMT
jgi:putative transposase